MVKHYAVVLAALFAAVSVQSQKLSDTKFGKGMVNHVAKDSSWSVKFAPRIQMLSSTNWDYEDGNFGKANTSFLIRRARLKFDGFAFSPKFKYKIELGLSNRDISGGSIYTRDTPRIILDAVIKWNFHENFVLWAGQTKLPGNRERVISSANLQLVDRSLLNANFNIDRDIGLQLRHHFNLTDKFVVREIVSIAQGEGRNITYGNLGGHQFTGRLEFLPFGTFKSKGDYLGSSLQRESSVKLNFAIGFDHNNNAVKTRSNQGEFMITDDGFYETDINTVFIDAILKYKGFSFMAEYAKRTADDPIAKNSDNTPTGFVVREGTGLNIQSGYLFPKNWELTGRLSHVDVVDKDLTNQYTLGFSKYFAGHKLKIQSDLSYLNLDLLGDNLMYRLQLEVHF
ncbi:porin [Urechidicola vernalis]|uniref:Porin n=1 Tax=Urechidicola vernalis TaxID=3075600 RepID=A0ABU2Y9D5_9FLAO|nr:porin [Urechidicola sp. P050]MDT0553678.1 porin [Urechidicola sp. P050]